MKNEETVPTKTLEELHEEKRRIESVLQIRLKTIKDPQKIREQTFHLEQRIKGIDRAIECYDTLSAPPTKKQLTHTFPVKKAEIKESKESKRERRKRNKNK